MFFQKHFEHLLRQTLTNREVEWEGKTRKIRGFGHSSTAGEYTSWDAMRGPTCVFFLREGDDPDEFGKDWIYLAQIEDQVQAEVDQAMLAATMPLDKYLNEIKPNLPRTASLEDLPVVEISEAEIQEANARKDNLVAALGALFDLKPGD